MGELAKVISIEFLKEDVIPMFQSLAQDEQDSVRLLAVEASTSIAKILSEKDNESLIIPILRTTSSVSATTTAFT